MNTWKKIKTLQLIKYVLKSKKNKNPNIYRQKCIIQYKIAQPKLNKQIHQSMLDMENTEGTTKNQYHPATKMIVVTMKP